MAATHAAPVFVYAVGRRRTLHRAGQAFIAARLFTRYTAHACLRTDGRARRLVAWTLAVWALTFLWDASPRFLIQWLFCRRFHAFLVLALPHPLTAPTRARTHIHPTATQVHAFSHAPGTFTHAGQHITLLPHSIPTRPTLLHTTYGRAATPADSPAAHHPSAPHCPPTYPHHPRAPLAHSTYLRLPALPRRLPV